MYIYIYIQHSTAVLSLELAITAHTLTAVERGGNNVKGLNDSPPPKWLKSRPKSGMTVLHAPS